MILGQLEGTFRWWNDGWLLREYSREEKENWDGEEERLKSGDGDASIQLQTSSFLSFPMIKTLFRNLFCLEMN